MSVREVAQILSMSKANIFLIARTKNIQKIWQEKGDGVPRSRWLIDTDSLAEYFNQLNP